MLLTKETHKTISLKALTKSVEKYTDSTTIDLAEMISKDCRRLVEWCLIMRHDGDRELIGKDLERLEEFILYFSNLLSIQMVEMSDGVLKGPLVDLLDMVREPQQNAVEPDDIQ